MCKYSIFITVKHTLKAIKAIIKQYDKTMFSVFKESNLLFIIDSPLLNARKKLKKLQTIRLLL